MADYASTQISLSQVSSESLNNDTTVKMNIIVGQFIAILSVIVGLMSQKIQLDFEMQAPLFLLASHSAFFFLISLILSSRPLKFRFIYVLVAIAQSQASFLNIYAFQLLKFKFPYFISIMSLILTLPLSLIFVKHTNFSCFHYLGMLLCTSGVALPLTDAIIKNEFHLDTSKHSLFGLLVCVSSAILFALSAVLQERYFTSGEEIYDYFFFGSFINSFICLGEGWLLGELPKIHFSTWGWQISLCFITFLLSMALIQLVTPFYIKRFSASMFNISVVSQIFWGGAYGIVFQEKEVFL